MTVMKIEKIYAYPVKALRAVELDSATATAHGFTIDRRFMLVKTMPDGTYKNMHAVSFPETSFFKPTLNPGDDGLQCQSITVTHSPPGAAPKSITFPAQPSCTGLEQVDVVMHKSPTKGFDMGAEYNDFFSTCLGYKVKLLFLGANLRDVLMTTRDGRSGAQSWASWATSLVAGPRKEQVTFADCAPYLIVSRTSLHNVSSRLPDGEEMDIVKFRPNLVISGAGEAWEEDFWAEITIGRVKFDLVQNCARCSSINIDYSTGKMGEGESGKILKKLQSDRRVDLGAKYSPIFGRYSFLDEGVDAAEIKVGDEVLVTRRNAERTTFDWPGLG